MLVMETTATQERFFALAESFQLDKPGASPWDADLLDASYAGASHGEKVTIAFLLNVWNPGHEWKCGKFDLIDAISVWDRGKREAFLSWAADPFWP